MKLLLFVIVFFIAATSYSQRYLLIDKRYKEPMREIESIKDYASGRYFLIYSKDKDTVVNALHNYVKLFSKVGRANYPFTDTEAGNTVIKVATKPMAYGDRYTISAETEIDKKVSRIMFGDARQKNKYTVENIERFLQYLKQ